MLTDKLKNQLMELARRRAWLAAAVLLLAAAVPCALAQEPAAEAPAVPPTEMAAPTVGMPDQVRFEARVLEWQVTNNFEFDFAVRYTPFPASASAILDGADLTLPADPSLTSAARLFFDGDVADYGTFDGMIEMLEEVGQVRILSKPSIVLTMAPGLDPATINTPTEAAVQKYTLSNAVKVPYETTKSVGVQLASVTEYRDTGVTIDVAILDIVDDEITIDMTTTVTNLTGFINIGLNAHEDPMRVPTIDKRTISNRLIVPDRSVFIAGLMKTSRQGHNRRGIPWLSEVPWLGTLLSSHQNRSEESELVFLVKPQIMTPYSIIDPDDMLGEGY